MKVKVDKIVPTSEGLRFGCVVYYQDEGPVRFVDASVDYNLFDWAVVASIVDALNRALDAEPADDPLF